MDKIRQKKQKDIIQQRAVTLFREHDNILLQWCTGASKSLAALKCVDTLGKEPEILLVVAEELHKGNWIEEISKWKYSHLIPNMEIICYASLHNYVGTKWDAVILDECHHLSEYRDNSLSLINYKKLINLSATCPDEIKYRLNQLKPGLVVDTITLKQGIESGILPEPVIYLVPTELNDDERRIDYKFGKKFSKITEFQANERLESTIEFWRRKYEETDQQWAKNKMLAAATQRKKLLAESKTKRAKKLLENELKDYRAICFCGSIEQCDILGGSNAIHSKKPKGENQLKLTQFNIGQIDKIFVNKMGREGLNLNEIEAGLIIQLDSGGDEGLSFLQQFGRALRADIPEMYIMYVKNTQDEKYVKRAIAHVDKKYIKIYGQESKTT